MAPRAGRGAAWVWKQEPRGRLRRRAHNGSKGSGRARRRRGGRGGRGGGRLVVVVVQEARGTRALGAIAAPTRGAGRFLQMRRSPLRVRAGASPRACGPCAGGPRLLKSHSGCPLRNGSSAITWGRTSSIARRPRALRRRPPCLRRPWIQHRTLQRRHRLPVRHRMQSARIQRSPASSASPTPLRATRAAAGATARRPADTQRRWATAKNGGPRRTGRQRHHDTLAGAAGGHASGAGGRQRCIPCDGSGGGCPGQTWATARHGAAERQAAPAAAPGVRCA